MNFLEESINIVAGLQEEVYTRIELIKVTTSADELIEYYHYLYALIEKQQILLMRLKLIDNRAYDGINLGIEMVADALGRQPEESVLDWHNSMKEEILIWLESLTGFPHDPSQIEVDITWDE